MHNHTAMHQVLWGLGVGDAYGERFATNPRKARRTHLPPRPWPTTDDTAMALAVADTLVFSGWIDPDLLALCLVRRFVDDPGRGYGSGTRRILDGVRSGLSWRRLAAEAFGGRGSMGNGAAVRAAPIGAFLENDRLSIIAEEARQSARPTHTHLEATEGAAAVAVAVAAHHRQLPIVKTTRDHLRPSLLRERLFVAQRLPLRADPAEAARVLGCGFDVTAQDTVPFALWMAARPMDPATRLVAAAQVGGDTDTVCAIIGAVAGAPLQWRDAIEPLAVSLASPT